MVGVAAMVVKVTGVAAVTAGDVSLTASGQIAIGSINASGGPGGDGDLGYDGGEGGDGGVVSLDSTGDRIMMSASSEIKTFGGAGGIGDYGGSIGSSGNINLEANGNITLGSLNAGSDNIDVTAGGGIYDANGSLVNLKADTINLTSYGGGVSGGLAISADIDNSDDEVNELNAEVRSTASYGGISLRVAGDSPSYVEIWDGAQSQNSIYFSATQDIDIDGDQYFSTDNDGEIMLFAGRDVNWISDGFTLDTGSAVVAAARDVNVSDNIVGDGDSLALIAGRDLNIDWTGSISQYWLDILLIGSTVNNQGDVNAGNDLDILAGTVRNSNYYGGELNADHDLTIIAGNIITDGIDGGEGGAHFDAGRDITALVAGNITLTNMGHFYAGNDVSLILTGADSILSLSNGGYVLANAITTITLDFTSRSSGGVMIDGLPSFTSFPGGSGLFVLNNYTPAVAGAGLVVKYGGSGGGGDICTILPGLCVAPNQGDSSSDSTPKFGKADKDKKGTCSEGEFGCDEGENGKKDDKSEKKTVAQCSI